MSEHIYMNYQSFEPSDILADFVKCYWTLVSPGDGTLEKQTIVPDGCMEMIFHYGDHYRQYVENGASIIQPKCFVFGQLTRPLEIEPMGVTGIFSVRFHPNGFLPFTSIRIKEIENTAVSMERLFGDEGNDISQSILAAESTSERINLIDGFLMGRLSDIETVDRIVKSAVDTILTANGQLSIDQLSRQININRRQLERKFMSTIGLSPKQLSKTIRLQSALKSLLSNSFKSLTELALDGEYYDQSHFNKDFKELTGFTPSEFYGNSLQMSTLLYRE